MLRQMSLKQLDEWMLFEQLEPFPADQAIWHSAYIVATLCNIHRGKGKAAKKVSEFVLPFGDAESYKKQQTWQEQKQIMSDYFKMWDAQERRAEARAAAAAKRLEQRRAEADVRRERRDSQRRAAAGRPVQRRT